MAQTLSQQLDWVSLCSPCLPPALWLFLPARYRHGPAKGQHPPTSPPLRIPLHPSPEPDPPGRGCYRSREMHLIQNFPKKQYISRKAASTLYLLVIYSPHCETV